MSKTNPLLQIWKDCPLFEGRRIPDEQLEEFVDNELHEGRTPGQFDASLRLACATVSDGPDLWQAGLELAQAFSFDDDTHIGRDARLFYLAVTGPLKALDSWLVSGQNGTRFHQAFCAWLLRLASENELPDDDIVAFVCPLLLHPAALAAATPEHLRTLLDAFLDERSVHDNPTILEHHRLLDSDPLTDTAATPCGTRILVVALVDREPSDTLDAKYSHLFEAVLDTEPDDVGWDIGCDAMGVPNLCTLHPPQVFNGALATCLTHHLVIEWTNDLADRDATYGRDITATGGRLNWIADHITHVELRPDGEDAVVLAQSTLGPLVPLRIPLPWANTGGSDTLSDCINEVSGLSLDDESNQEMPITAPLSKIRGPAARHRLH